MSWISKGTTKPYLHFIGGNASNVTGSCTILRFNDIKLAVEMGSVQTNNIVADYRSNRDLMKKIKPKTIHGAICFHIHQDHVGNLLQAVACGMRAYIYIPQNSTPLLKIMLEDAAKILLQDSIKLQNKHGIKAPPLATPEDVDKVLQWIVEVPFNKPTEIVGGAKLTLYDSGHIVNAAQGVIEFNQGRYVTKRIGFTSDINTEEKSKSVRPIQPLPRTNCVVAEATYSDPRRCYSMKKDRWYDEQMIKTAVSQYNKILFPTFALQRSVDILEVLKKLEIKCPIYLDSPLAEKIYRKWTELLDYESSLNLHIIKSWDESQELQMKDEHMILLASSGMMTAGRVVSHLKYILPNPNNCILFCGFSAENTTASEIKRGTKEIKVEGEMIPNKAQIYCLNTFSSHANYNQLMDYYTKIDYDKICVVHSDFDTKVTFCQELQDRLHNGAKSSKVICVNQDQKIYL